MGLKWLILVQNEHGHNGPNGLFLCYKPSAFNFYEFSLLSFESGQDSCCVSLKIYDMNYDKGKVDC